MEAPNPYRVSHGAANNGLCQLPDELLLQIFGSLALLDIQLMKRCCRRLLYLCEKFAHQDFPNAVELVGGNSSNSPRRLWWQADHKPYELRDALTRDRTCHDCTRLRADRVRFSAALKALERLRWCSGCKCAHHSFLFSHTERDKSSLDRKCIGMEGYVRLCQHKVVSWSDILRLKAAAKQRVPLVEVGIECRDARHLSNMSHLTQCAVGCFPRAQYHNKFPDTLMVSSKMAVYLANEDKSISADGIAWLLSEATRSALVYACPHVYGRKYRVAEPVPPIDRAGLDGYRHPKQYRSRRVEHSWSCVEQRCRQYMKLDAITTGGKTFAEHGEDTALETPSEARGCRDVFLRSYNTISVESPTDPAWLSALDPESYLCIEDEEAKGIMWCENEDCPTMFRSLARSKLFSWRLADSESVAGYIPYTAFFQHVVRDM